MTDRPTRCAALHTGPEFHGLDHIAPLAALMEMPLIIAEEQSAQLARRYYPQVEIEHWPDLEHRLGQIAERFDALFECKYWAPHVKEVFQHLYQKEMQLIFCPHGQSDKGFGVPLLEPYGSQDGVLLYGDLMIQMLKELEVWPKVSRWAMVGNYRLKFYQKHRAFYDALVEKEIPLDRNKRTLLYAPTWRDADRATSFFQYGKKVIEQLPEDWNLIVKVHPLLEQRDPAQFYAVAAQVEKKAGAILVHEWPLVYPLLMKADVYLGDASSVGYDFLWFQRPLYFFPSGRRGRLHQCGQVLDAEKNIYAQIEAENLFEKEQKELYQFAFGAEREEKEVRNRIDGMFKEERDRTGLPSRF